MYGKCTAQIISVHLDEFPQTAHSCLLFIYPKTVHYHNPWNALVTGIITKPPKVNHILPSDIIN